MRARASRCKRACLVARTALAVCFGATVAGVAAARAEPTFPSKPIHIFIPYGAGGVADLTMRLLAQKLTERTKQQVVIENRPGAAGLLAAKEVLRAPPDGYTLDVIGNGQAIAMSLFKTRPYNVLADLGTAVLRGDVDVGFDFYAGLQALISDNQVRIIATSGEERNPLLRNVPTARESGFPEYIVTSWNGLASAAGMPGETLGILNQHVNAALADPALQATASTLGMDARGSPPQHM